MTQDLRSFLAKLERQNDLARIQREVDRRHEIAALLKRAAEQDGPALYFEHVRDSAMPVVANVAASKRRLALTLGTSVDGLLESYRTALESPIAPVNVSGSGQPEKLSGLSSLPVTTISERDIGPYITAGIIFAAHPETGKVNLSFQRMCPISDSEAAIYVGNTSDLFEYAKAAEGKRLPIVVAIGLHPAFHLIASTRFPPEMEEVELVGGLLGEGVRLTQNGAGQWLVPESAEVVLEGEIDFQRTAPEGPFGEYPGYYGGGSLTPRQSPVVTFSSMTSKKNPIYQTLITGPTIGYESAHFSCLSKEAMLYTMTSRICPQVCAVSVSVSRNVAVLQLDGDISTEMAKRLMFEVFSNLVFIKYVVLIDADVNASDPLDLLWALSTRVDPGVQMHIFPEMTMEPLDPSTKGSCSKVGFDARKPIGERSGGFIRARIPGYEEIRLEDYLAQ